MTSTRPAPVSGFVLAGGRSRRMGRDKALIEVSGEALAVRVARTLREGGCGCVALVGGQRSLAGLGWPVVVDPPGAFHPLRGVVAALESCETALALFSPCDLAGLLASDVAALLATGGPCVAEAATCRHHLLAVIPRSYLDRARALVESGGPARALVEDLPSVELPLDAVRNVNTVADLDGLDTDAPSS